MNIKATIISTTLCIACAACTGPQDGLKASDGCKPAAAGVQKPFETPGRHGPKLVMGREYWSYLHAGSIYTDPYIAGVVLESEKKTKKKNPWNNFALTNLPVFRDCALVRPFNRPPPDANGTSASWRTVKENAYRSNLEYESLEADSKKDKPMVLVFGSKRNVLAMVGDVDLDHADWAAFKKAHPNLVGTRTMCEWGNDMLMNKIRTTNVLNQVRRDELMSVWKRFDMANRYDRIKMCRWYTDRKLKLHYDDMDTFMAFRAMYHLDHVAAAWGAKALTVETTNSTSGDSEYRWDIMGMFTRGAARQFGLPWCWYVAVYLNGPAKDGSWKNDSVCNLRRPYRNAIPEGGTSASAQRRCFYYAYLNGANAVEPESWATNFFTTNDTPDGIAQLSVRGKNFSDFHDFTAAHPDRGVTYAPVAILTPFAQGYKACGGMAWGTCPYTDGDYAIDAVMFSIAPGWERAKALRAGIQEGNLHNSRFAMMYDVLVPDSPQPKEEFKKALFAYPAAILVGDYPDPSMFEDVLAEYEKAGGRLIRITAADLPPRKPRAFLDIYSGKLRFPSVERTLEGLQRDLFPFAVEGDCQFGANRTKDGWWLWVFNNKGVRKYADTFETIDATCARDISVKFVHAAVAPVTELVSGRKVDVKDGRFSYRIPASDFAVFKIGR
ncbi:MAG: hypothetical protein IKO72_01205 [Kiritimatiellae bacterium]|nr:hypothetical protein [Kiritimatiellia bacterium]